MTRSKRQQRPNAYEVEGAVEAAVQLGDVDVERELLVQQVEHAVLGAARVEQVSARTNVRRKRSLRDELERQLVAARGGAVSALPVVRRDAVDGTVGCARVRVRAERGVPQVAGVAVGVTGNLRHM